MRVAVGEIQYVRIRYENRLGRCKGFVGGHGVQGLFPGAGHSAQRRLQSLGDMEDFSASGFGVLLMKAEGEV